MRIAGSSPQGRVALIHFLTLLVAFSVREKKGDAANTVRHGCCLGFALIPSPEKCQSLARFMRMYPLVNSVCQSDIASDDCGQGCQTF